MELQEIIMKLKNINILDILACKIADEIWYPLSYDLRTKLVNSQKSGDIKKILRFYEN